jgi:hypothetical protein
LSRLFGLLDRHPKAASLGILIAGAIASVAIWLSTADDLGDDLEETKPYLRQLEVYGGKANLLATQIRHGLYAALHGRGLAWTVLVIAAALALLVQFLFGKPAPRR